MAGRPEQAWHRRRLGGDRGAVEEGEEGPPRWWTWQWGQPLDLGTRSWLTGACTRSCAWRGEAVQWSVTGLGSGAPLRGPWG